MKKYFNSITVLTLLLVSVCGSSCATKENIPKLEGFYSNGEMGFEFKEGMCSIYHFKNLKGKVEYKVKDGFVYISPPKKDLKKMSRQAWPVYKIENDRIVANHVEDMETGEKFYENLKGTIVLKKKK
jgi:hypothetical protein